MYVYCLLWLYSGRLASDHEWVTLTETSSWEAGRCIPVKNCLISLCLRGVAAGWTHVSAQR